MTEPTRCTTTPKDVNMIMPDGQKYRCDRIAGHRDKGFDGCVFVPVAGDWKPNPDYEETGR